MKFYYKFLLYFPGMTFSSYLHVISISFKQISNHSNNVQEFKNMLLLICSLQFRPILLCFSTSPHIISLFQSIRSSHCLLTVMMQCILFVLKVHQWCNTHLKEPVLIGVNRLTRATELNADYDDTKSLFYWLMLNYVL